MQAPTATQAIALFVAGEQAATGQAVRLVPYAPEYTCRPADGRERSDHDPTVGTAASANAAEL